MEEYPKIVVLYQGSTCPADKDNFLGKGYHDFENLREQKALLCKRCGCCLYYGELFKKEEKNNK